MNTESRLASDTVLRRAWLQEIGIEWRGPLPAPILVQTALRAETPAPDAPRPLPEVDRPKPEPVPREPEVDDPPTEVPQGDPGIDEPHDQPSEEPVIDEPPRERPPADEPPVDDPSHEPPPVEEPPIDEPSRDRPPIGEPSMAKAVRPAAQAAAHAAARQRKLVRGAWRWSWWQAHPQGPAGPTRALLLRPATAPRATDAQARDLLAAAMKAVGLQPIPRRDPALGGVWQDGVDLAWLHQSASEQAANESGLPVIWCLPHTNRTLLASVLSQPHAVPGTRWPLAGEPPLQLVLVPAPEEMLTQPDLKRVAWQALAPLRR